MAGLGKIFKGVFKESTEHIDDIERSGALQRVASAFSSHADDIEHSVKIQSKLEKNMANKAYKETAAIEKAKRKLAHETATAKNLSVREKNLNKAFSDENYIGSKVTGGFHSKESEIRKQYEKQISGIKNAKNTKKVQNTKGNAYKDIVSDAKIKKDIERNNRIKDFHATNKENKEFAVEFSHVNQAEQHDKAITSMRHKDLVNRMEQAKSDTKNMLDNNNRFTSKTLKGKKFNSPEDFMRNKVSNQYESVIDDFDNKNFKNPLFNDIKQSNALEHDSDITREMIDTHRYNALSNVSKNDMGLMDYAGYYKVPQKAVAGGGALFLASKVMRHGGEQSNASLYGQQQNY